MSFKQIYNDGVAAHRAGKTLLENPFYRPENLPVETASAYRAWQIKAEAWEQGFRSQQADKKSKCVSTIDECAQWLTA